MVVIEPAESRSGLILTLGLLLYCHYSHLREKFQKFSGSDCQSNAPLSPDVYIQHHPRIQTPNTIKATIHIESINAKNITYNFI